MTESRERRSISTEGLATDIVRLLQRERARAGDRLVELRLARELGLSRSPLRRALTELAGRGLVAVHPNRGFTLLKDLDDPDFLPVLDTDTGDEAAYLRIAADRLEKRLPDVVTETALSRDYGLGRADVGRILARMAREGWIERRAGYGWQFLPMFPTREAYLHGYRYRLLVEPAAVLEPGFHISGAQLDRIEAEQMRMARTGTAAPSVTEMFHIGCSFHEALVAASGNPFMFDAVQRVNKMRRLIEYRALAPALVAAQSEEHLAIIAALRRDDRQQASSLLHQHLANASDAKLKRLQEGNISAFDEPTL